MKVKTEKWGYVPIRSNPNDAGADLISPITVNLSPQSSVFIDLGVAIQLPKDTVGLVFARSGLGGKGVRPRNCVGVIDEKYYDNIGVMLENASNQQIRICEGDRVAQLVVIPVIYENIELVDEFEKDGDRGGGFGSTGK